MTDAELLETKRTFDQLDEDGMTNYVLFAIQYPQAIHPGVFLSGE